MLNSLQTLMKKQAARLLPAGAVTAVLAGSLFVGTAGIIGLGTGYNYGVGACTSANVTAAPASPSIVGTATVTLTGTATGCTHPEFQFYVQPPGGAFAATGAYIPWNGTNTTNFTWATAGLAPGIYGIGVWARNSGSTAAYDVFAIGTYTLTGNCNVVTIADSLNPSAPGAAVTWTATAGGCPGAVFKWLALAPGGSAWVVIQDYPSSGTGNQYKWLAGATNASTQGIYQIGVWAKQAGSASAYDTYAIATHVLLASCATAAISAAPASPQAAGTITVSATAAGCTGPLFEFWVLSPGGGWVSQGAFSTTATLSFDANGAARGQYRFGVWVKDPKSANTYDSYAIITFYVGS
jgi:hypothetical protein